MRVPLETLVALDDDGLFESLIWIDWRSFESDVVDAFSQELPDSDAITCVDDEDPREIVHRGTTYPIPLTLSGKDRYVMICSIIELLKDRYTVFVDRESYRGADTHGFLLLTNEEATTAARQHGDWLNRTFERVQPGVDGFSGKTVPYLGHALPDVATTGSAGRKPFWKFW